VPALLGALILFPILLFLYLRRNAAIPEAYAWALMAIAAGSPKLKKKLNSKLSAELKTAGQLRAKETSSLFFPFILDRYIRSRRIGVLANAII
jgi:hypothetical protein